MENILTTRRSLIRQVVRDMVTAFKTMSPGNFILPDDITGEMMYESFDRISFQVEFNCIENFEIMDFEIDGGFYVVLNNRENTVVWLDPKTGKPYKNMGKYDKNDLIVKDFKYITLKRPGKAMEPDVNVKKELFAWIKDNVPPNSLDTKELDKL